MYPQRKLSRSWAHDMERFGPTESICSLLPCAWVSEELGEIKTIWWLRSCVSYHFVVTGIVWGCTKAFLDGRGPCQGKCWVVVGIVWALCGNVRKPKHASLIPPNTRQKAWFSCHGNLSDWCFRQSVNLNDTTRPIDSLYNSCTIAKPRFFFWRNIHLEWKISFWYLNIWKRPLISDPDG